MTIPGCGYRDAVLLDYLHIFHLGYGMDSAASAIVLLAHLGHYGHARSLDARLAVAYDYFDDWCHREGRTSSIDAFSKAREEGVSWTPFGSFVRAWFNGALPHPSQVPHRHGRQGL